MWECRLAFLDRVWLGVGPRKAINEWRSRRGSEKQTDKGKSTVVQWVGLFLMTDRCFVYLCVCVCVCAHVLSCGQLFATPWTVARPTPLFAHGNFPGKNTGVGCHFLLQGSLLPQGLNLYFLCLLHWRQILYWWATWAALDCCYWLSNKNT